MATRNIQVVTKLTPEFSEQPWDFGYPARISVLHRPAAHFPCHITGNDKGLVYTHGTECVAIPWTVIQAVVEAANAKLIAPPPPENTSIAANIKAALDEAAKLPVN